MMAGWQYKHWGNGSISPQCTKGIFIAERERLLCEEEVKLVGWRRENQMRCGMRADAIDSLVPLKVFCQV